ncbi:MAG: hypothetical protein D6736_15460 [Nitrospinota bacterium]|nr:MAG: hypothetical protein D6736_15460 [Nitrospinota bacterium]
MLLVATDSFTTSRGNTPGFSSLFCYFYARMPWTPSLKARKRRTGPLSLKISLFSEDEEGGGPFPSPLLRTGKEGESPGRGGEIFA